MQRLAEIDLVPGQSTGRGFSDGTHLVVGIRDWCSATVVNRVQANHRWMPGPGPLLRQYTTSLKAGMWFDSCGEVLSHGRRLLMNRKCLFTTQQHNTTTDGSNSFPPLTATLTRKPAPGCLHVFHSYVISPICSMSLRAINTCHILSSCTQLLPKS